jgi:hypothetical protein
MIFLSYNVLRAGNDRIQNIDENGTFVKQWDSVEKDWGDFTPLREDLGVDSKNDIICMIDGAHIPSSKSQVLYAT